MQHHRAHACMSWMWRLLQRAELTVQSSAVSVAWSVTAAPLIFHNSLLCQALSRITAGFTAGASPTS